MSIEVIVPRLGWSMEEGAFVAWLKKDGELVHAGEPLFSIEGDKAVQEIESIDGGILRIVANGPKPGDPVRVGDLLGHLVSATATAPVSTATGSTATAVKPTPPQPLTTAEPPPIIPAQQPTAPPASNVPKISPRALRVATELGVDWTSITGSGRTGRIRERDIRAAGGSSNPIPPAPLPSAAPFTADQKSTVLVTGGCGFIGTWVVRELLLRGLRVVVLDASGRPARWDRVIGPASESVTLIQGSLLDWELLARMFSQHPITHIIHLAALLTPACQADPWEGCRVNVLGTLALFEKARLSATPIQGFSYASSVAVFGDEPDHAHSAPGDDNHPLTFYGAFKKSVELIAAQYWQHHQLASVGIRPQVAYGPEREVGLTAGPSLAARAAARGEDFCITYTGKAGYDYVEDVARAFVHAALETPRGAAVVDLPGEVAEVSQIIAAIAAAVPATAPRVSAKGPPIPAHVPPNPRYISALYPDWKTTSLVEGIRRTVGFYQTR